MDPELAEGATPPDSLSDTPEPGPSLIDTLSEEFGFDERGEATDQPTGDAPIVPAAPAAPPAGTPAPGAPPADPNAAPKPGVPPESKPDPNAELYAPLPEHNQRKTHERFQKLVDSHKDLSSKFEAAAQESTQLKGALQQYEAGIQPLREMGFDTREAVADLQQFSVYRKALAGGDIPTAMGILQQQMQELALASGKRVEVDPIAAFPDLAERVRVGDIDTQTGLELARSRHQNATRDQMQRRQQSQQSQQDHTQQQVRAGVQAINVLVQDLMKSPDYAAVEPRLMPQLQAIKDKYLPHQWADQIRQVYDYERRLLAAEQQHAQAASRPAPLRATGHPGGQPAPKTAADAAMQALGMS